MKLIEMNMDKIIALCKKYKVDKLWVFGSILTPRFNDQSDVDFSFKFENDVNYLTYADNFFGFYYDLKELFNREVDLVDETALKNKYFIKELNNTKRLIYG